MDVIKDALERLTTNPIVWNTLKQDRTADWGVCTFLAGAELSGGRLRYVLNPLLREKVEHPTLFAKIQLLVQTHFSSKYALALYEFLIDEIGRAGNPQTHTVQVPLDTVRHVIQFDGDYKHLNNDVLKPCVLEINKHSDLAIGYRGIKGGRAVTALLFTISRQAMQLSLADTEYTVAPSDMATQDLSEVPLLQSPLVVALVEKGVNERKAKALVKKYEPQRISENIELVEREHQAGKVKVLSAYLIRAIEDDYRPRLPPAVALSAADAVQGSQQDPPAPGSAARTKERKRLREQRVRERFAALPAAEQDAYREAFHDELKTSGSILLRQFKKDGFASRLVDAQFFSELQEKLLTAPED
jgi:hypothetical protein